MKNSTNSTILKYDRQVPRYTSYPTAPHFKEDIGFENYKSWLKALDEKEKLSLYFHIPFCQQMCWYCGCFTKITQRYAPIEDYVSLLIREIKIIGEILGQKHLVEHIHFGGGSPTILPKSMIQDLMATIRDNFTINKNAQIAIEIDPRTVNEEKIACYANEGINRASLGIQDFNHEVQIAINREQSFDMVYDAVKCLRSYDINDINFDLIYGLPKQNIEMVKRNIDYSLLLNPNRIALFGYAHVSWMKKHMRLIDENKLPNSKARLSMYQNAASRLKQNGFEAIGLDHFAKKDDDMFLALKNKKLKRNFQGYSTDNAEVLIGFGTSSISYLPYGYVQNTLDLEEYKKAILNNILPIKKGVKTSKEDDFRKKIIDQIMCYLEVDLNKICQEFDIDPDYFQPEILKLKELEKDNLITLKNYKITINEKARPITRLVSSFFDKYLEPENKKHSKIA